MQTGNTPYRDPKISTTPPLRLRQSGDTSIAEVEQHQLRTCVPCQPDVSCYADRKRVSKSTSPLPLTVKTSCPSYAQPFHARSHPSRSRELLAAMQPRDPPHIAALNSFVIIAWQATSMPGSSVGAHALRVVQSVSSWLCAAVSHIVFFPLASSDPLGLGLSSPASPIRSSGTVPCRHASSSSQPSKGVRASARASRGGCLPFRDYSTC